MMLLVWLALSAGARETSLDCDPDLIDQTLFTAVPRRAGAARLLESALDPASREARCLAETAERFKTKLEQGRLFRQRYLEQYANITGDESDQRLLLAPDQEILRRAFAAPTSRTRGEATPPEWRLEQDALTETRARFGLRAGYTLADLERDGRGTDLHFARALLFYRAQVKRLRENLKVQKPVRDKSPERFKAEMTMRLGALRRANLVAAARHSIAGRGVLEFSFDDLQTGAKISLTTEELATADLSFFDDSLTPDANRVPSFRRHAQRLISKYVRKRDPLDAAKTAYEAIPAAILQRPGVVRITPVGRPPVLISGADYQAVLHDLGPARASDHHGEDPVDHRFAAEITYRDALLGNAAAFLNARIDRSLNELSARLRQRIATRAPNLARASAVLTLEIQEGAAKVLDSGPSADAIWFGWSKSPDYWRVREAAAEQLKLPRYDEASITPISKKALAKEEDAARLRYVSDAERQRAVGRAKGAFGATFAVTSALAYAVATNFSALPSLPHWDFGGYFGREAIFSFDQKLEANNYEFPADQAGPGNGPKKGRQDKHDPSSSPYYIEVLSRSDRAPAPKYYNISAGFQLEEAARRAKESPETFKGYGRSVYEDDWKRADLVVDVNFRNRLGQHRRLGLLQMTGYYLRSLEMYDWRGAKVDSRAIHVYELPRTHQMYAEMDAGWSGPFTYRAYYDFEPEVYRARDLQEGVPGAAVAHVTGRLASSGFTRLAENLPAGPAPVRYEDLQAVFNGTGYYTYKGITYPTNARADAAFRPFTKFVDHGDLKYQCTGSNLLYQTTVNEILAQTPNPTEAFASSLLGYGGDGDGVKRGTVGHLHSLVTSRDGYLELDATPTTELQARPQSKADVEPAPQAEAPHPDATPAPPIVPNGSWYEIWKTAIHSSPPGPTEPKAVAEDSGTSPVPPRALGPARLTVALERLTQARAQAVRATRPASESNPMLRTIPMANLPGLRLLVLSRILLDEAARGSSPGHLLARLRDPSARVAPEPITNAGPLLRQFFRREVTSLNKTLRDLQLQIDHGRGAGLEELTVDPARSSLLYLAELMATYPWDQMLSPPSVAAAKACASDLGESTATGAVAQ